MIHWNGSYTNDILTHSKDVRRQMLRPLNLHTQKYLDNIHGWKHKKLTWKVSKSIIYVHRETLSVKYNVHVFDSFHKNDFENVFIWLPSFYWSNELSFASKNKYPIYPIDNWYSKIIFAFEYNIIWRLVSIMI